MTEKSEARKSFENSSSPHSFLGLFGFRDQMFVKDKDDAFYSRSLHREFGLLRSRKRLPSNISTFSASVSPSQSGSASLSRIANAMMTRSSEGNSPNEVITLLL